MAQRLTLNLGARLAFDQLDNTSPDQGSGSVAQIYPEVSFARIDLPAWNTIVRRLYAAYDLTNDGKTVIKGGWGRFVTFPALEMRITLTPAHVPALIYRWRDLNGNRNYDPGEVNLDPNGSDFVSQTGFTRGILNPDEESPLTDEFTLSFERELFPNFAVRATGVYSSVTRNAQTINPLIPYEAYTIPITNRDPGETALSIPRTTPDDGHLMGVPVVVEWHRLPGSHACKRPAPGSSRTRASSWRRVSACRTDGRQWHCNSWTRLNEPPNTP